MLYLRPWRYGAFFEEKKLPGTQCFAKYHKQIFAHNLFSIRSKKKISEHLFLIASVGPGRFATTTGTYVKHREFFESKMDRLFTSQLVLKISSEIDLFSEFI